MDCPGTAFCDCGDKTSPEPRVRRTWQERHEQFDPGPATTSPRRLNFYGRFKRGDTAKLRRMKKEGVVLTSGGSFWRLVTKLVRTGRLKLAQEEEKQ